MKLFQSNLESGGIRAWIGDGFCDDMNNNENCILNRTDNAGGGIEQFDGGDCCGTDAMHNYCIECICFGTAKFKLLHSKLVH